MSEGYVWEKAFVMLHGMATSDLPLTRRLVACYRGSLIRLQPEDMPSDMKEDFTKLDAALRRLAEADAKGTDPGTLTSDHDARLLVEDIIVFYGKAHLWRYAEGR